MPYAELPCTVCKQPGNEPCISLRTGKPIKKFHKDGRIIVLDAIVLNSRGLDPRKEA